MAAMKTLAIEIGFDATETEAALMRCAKGETDAARWRRLVKLAIARGCQVVALEEDGGWITELGVTSGSRAGVVHRVTDGARCDCEGYATHGRCTHAALVRAVLGTLPTEPEPEPPAPAVRPFVARRAA